MVIPTSPSKTTVERNLCLNKNSIDFWLIIDDLNELSSSQVKFSDKGNSNQYVPLKQVIDENDLVELKVLWSIVYLV